MTTAVKWGIALVTAILIIAAAIALWPAPDPAPLPPKLDRDLARHHAETAIDITEIRRLERAADSAAAAARRDSVARARAERAASAHQRRADSLATVAAAAATARDSAEAYAAAYHARTIEAEDLREALAASRSETQHQRQRGDSLQVALDTAKGATASANRLLAEAVAEVQRRKPPCRVLGPIPCPSRTVVAVAAAVGTAVGTAIVVHELERRDRERREREPPPASSVRLRGVTLARW